MKICLFCGRTFKSSYQSQKFCSEICANRFNLNGLKQILLPEKGEELTEFIGIMLGDGDLSKYQIKVTLNTKVDKEYITFIDSLIKRLFVRIIPFKIIRTTENCTVVGFSSRIAVDFLKEMGMQSWKPVVPVWIFEKKKYLASCIRGLIDTEGSIGFKIYKGKRQISVYRQLTFTSKNSILLRFVRDGLNHLGFKCTQSLIKNIYLSNDKDIDRYRSMIGFHNQKLEKRSLLRNYSDYNHWRGAGAVDPDSLENY